MNTVTESAEDRDTVIVPIVSLERMPRMTAKQRTAFLAELEEIEAAMKSGAYETYSPEWLEQRFLKIYKLSD